MRGGCHPKSQHESGFGKTNGAETLVVVEILDTKMILLFMSGGHVLCGEVWSFQRGGVEILSAFMLRPWGVITLRP